MIELETIERGRMDKLTAGLRTKAASIRRLAAAGYERADIARYLGVRYQYVYNVLSAPVARKDRARNGPTGSAETPARDPRVRTGSPQAPEWAWVRIEPDGRIALPATFLEALGLGEGDQVQLALDGDSIRILTRARALKELRTKVRRFVPEGVSLVDELIAERRAEAAEESRDD